MENFELIDNLFQIAVLLCACVAAGILPFGTGTAAS